MTAKTLQVSVLVVEDEPLIRLDLSEFLTESGFRVLEAGDADEAVTLLEDHDNVHLMITDVDMPGFMDGLELAKSVAGRWPSIRIVVVSGHRLVEITDIPDGSVFFSKPYPQSQLLASIHELLSCV